MNLADAFSQMECSIGEAQIILSTLISDLRDSYPDLYTSMSQAIVDLHEHEEVPPARSASSSNPSLKDKT